ncbi:MAG: cupin domain-containing protein [Firmicutes bacterium]|nr:cupin domain-containing protein [Bacillota bacterium]
MAKVVLADGVERETLAIGENLMIVRFTFRKDTEVPWHTHLHEQSSYIVQGRLKLLLQRDQGEQEIILTQGMSAIIPPNVQHKAIAMEDTVDVNAFTPIREDYL